MRGDPLFKQARVSALHSMCINNHKSNSALHNEHVEAVLLLDRISEPKKKLSDLSASGKQLHRDRTVLVLAMYPTLLKTYALSLPLIKTCFGRSWSSLPYTSHLFLMEG